MKRSTSFNLPCVSYANYAIFCEERTLRHPNFVAERSGRNFRYGTVIAFGICIGSLAVTHRSVSEYVKRGAESTRLSGESFVGASRDQLAARSANH
jgi:hypothetical protein